MPVDDMPKPDEEVSPDVAYQLGYDDASDLRGWVRTCLNILTAPIDLSDYDPMSLDAVRGMRVEAARAAARVFRALMPDGPDPDE